MTEDSAATGAGDEEVIIEDLRFAHEGVWRGICGKITLFSRAADALSASRDQLRAKDAEIERLRAREQELARAVDEYRAKPLHETLRAELTEAHDDIKALCDERRAKDAEIERLTKALQTVRLAIVEADPNVLTCTLWMPMPEHPAETVVDFIDAALKEQDQ